VHPLLTQAPSQTPPQAPQPQSAGTALDQQSRVEDPADGRPSFGHVFNAFATKKATPAPPQTDDATPVEGETTDATATLEAEDDGASAFAKLQADPEQAVPNAQAPKPLRDANTATAPEAIAPPADDTETDFLPAALPAKSLPQPDPKGVQGLAAQEYSQPQIASARSIDQTIEQQVLKTGLPDRGAPQTPLAGAGTVQPTPAQAQAQAFGLASKSPIHPQAPSPVAHTDVVTAREAQVQSLQQASTAVVAADQPTRSGTLPIPLPASALSPQAARSIAANREIPATATPPSTTPKPNLPQTPQWNIMSAAPVATPQDTQKTHAPFEGEISAIPRGETTSGLASSSAANTLPVRQDMPHHVARQIAEAMQHMPNRPVEITLSPEELGRVRLGVSMSEGGIMVTVLAERPETSDLMRRHISALETAFQELGYSDISFAFAGGEHANSDAHDKDAPDADSFSGTPQQGDAQTTQIHLSSAPLTGVDIRL